MCLQTTRVLTTPVTNCGYYNNEYCLVIFITSCIFITTRILYHNNNVLTSETSFRSFVQFIIMIKQNILMFA